MDADAIECHTELIHDVRAEEICVAEGCGVCEIVKTALCGGEDVLRKTVSGRLIERRRHVAAEDGMLLAQLVINTSQNLILVRLRDGTVRYGAAGVGGVIRRGQKLRDRKRLRADL